MALATPTDLASYMQQDVDTATATLVLDLASTAFESEADTKFASTVDTYTVEGCGQTRISLPKQPVISVTSVTIDGAAVTDYVWINSALYRTIGFGGLLFPYPSAVVVVYNYGYTSVPSDAKGAVLEMAALAYSNPNLVAREQIDDYAVQYAAPNGVLAVTQNASRIAGKYRIGAVA